MIKEQSAFLADVAKLIQWIHAHGGIVTGGELYRPAITQKYYVATGCSMTRNSNHQKRLAIDLNIFDADGHPAMGDSLKRAGQFWESLHPENRWGGNFKSFPDLDHFERNIGDGKVIPGA